MSFVCFMHIIRTMYVCMDHAWMFDDVCMDVCIPWLGRFQWLQCTNHSCIKDFKRLYKYIYISYTHHIHSSWVNGLIERERERGERSIDDISSGTARSSLGFPSTSSRALSDRTHQYLPLATSAVTTTTSRQVSCFQLWCREVWKKSW